MGLLAKLFGNKDLSQPKVDGIQDYVVFDFETTGLSRYYSEIIQIAAIKVNGGKVVDEFVSYVKPKREIPAEATEVNHITNEMVAGAPPFSEVVINFLEFISGYMLLGYNIAGYDLPLLNSRLYLDMHKRCRANYMDLFFVARRLQGLSNHKLTTVSEFLGINSVGAHDALVDCRLTHECYQALLLKGMKPDVKEFEGKPLPIKPKLSEASCAINILRDIMSGIVEDGVVEESELFELSTWVAENDCLKGMYPFDSISMELEKILEDGVVEQEELKELCAFIDEWLDPVGHARHDRITSLEGRHIVITGDFEFGDTCAVEEYITKRGGIVDNSTLRKTELVVVGSLGSTAWAAGNYGNKIKKALENREKGQVIQIVKEADFFKETRNL